MSEFYSESRPSIKVESSSVVVSLFTVFEEVGDPFSDHDDRGIRVGADAVRHYRAICQAKALNTSYTAVLVQNRHFV